MKQHDSPLPYTTTQAAWYDGHRRASMAIIEEISQALGFHRPNGPKSLLDLGCGSGNYLAALANRKWERLAGVDASKGMLERARIKLTAQNIELYHNDIRELPIKDKTFDAVILIHALHHVAGLLEYSEEHRLHERGQALAEAYRVLQPGGQLFLVQSDPWQNAANLLWSRYFPQALETKLIIQPKSQDLLGHLVKAGFAQADSWTFRDYETRPVFSPELALQDEFLPVYSEFSYLTPEALKAGRQKLRQDMENALLPALAAESRATYESRGGNFTAIWARKVSG